jgi:small-conductance mechanosensitive channel
MSEPLTGRPESPRLAVWLCWLQGLYFAGTGIWPLVSIRTFQAVTGKKTDHLVRVPPTEADHWLVNAVAVLVLACGLALLSAAWRRRVSLEVAILGIGAAIGLAAIDVVYVWRGTILQIYLADAAVEVVIIAAWLWCWSGVRRAEPR